MNDRWGLTVFSLSVYQSISLSVYQSIQSFSGQWWLAVGVDQFEVGSLQFVSWQGVVCRNKNPEFQDVWNSGGLSRRGSYFLRA
jgi:hypothetical protein